MSDGKPKQPDGKWKIEEQPGYYDAEERFEIIGGAPDLVVEILSASTGSRDKTIKKDCYEKFGVREYWLADPVYGTIDQFVLENGRYVLVATLAERNSIAAHSIPSLSFALKGMFPAADKMRSANQTFRSMVRCCFSD